MTANNSHAQTTRANAHPSGEITDYLPFTDQGGDPSAPSSGHPVVYAKSGGLYLRSNSGITGPFGTATPGGITQAYAGYNSIGGSSTAATANLIYLKKVTLAADCTIASIGAYVKQNTGGATLTIAVGLYTDNSGAPLYVVGGSFITIFGQITSGVAGSARWVDVPLGAFVAAGDYWIAFQMSNVNWDVYYDGSGSDRTIAPNSTPQLADYGGNIYTDTTTSNKYSLRANTIR